MWLPFLLTLILVSVARATAVPYLQPDLTGFTPEEGRYACSADDYAVKYCAWLGQEFPKLAHGYEIEPESSFAHFYPAGSNPSLELLVQTYPAGIIDPDTAEDVPKILTDVGPDVDITRDFGYGKIPEQLVNHGPLGGLPPFCRYGAFVKTSELTKALFEVWLPLEIDHSTPLVQPNASDFPTNSTPVYFDRQGNLVRVPLDYYPPADSGAEGKGDGTNKSPSEQEGGPKTITKRAQTFGSPGTDEGCIQGDDLLKDTCGWNGRHIQINNGGQRGFVPLTDLKQIMSRYHFAVSGTNAGHFSTTGGVDWAVGPQREETIRDWAHRSYYVTSVLATQLIELFYGPNSGVRVMQSDSQDYKDKTPSRLRSYLGGVSVGGGAGLGALQQHGAAWDGALIGAPALYFSDVNFAQIELAKIHRKKTWPDGVFDARVFGDQFHQSVLEQCDALDGVQDGIITEPGKCKLDFDKAILCGGGGKWSDDDSVCFTEAQVENLKKIFSEATVNGVPFRPGFPIGVEKSAKRLKSSSPKAVGWVQLAIQGETERDYDFAYSNGTDGGGFTIEDVEEGRQLNIGESNFGQSDLSGFFSGEATGGGKVLHYHGLADLQINSMPSAVYYESVLKDPKNGGEDRVKSNYKLYMIPGMDHGRDGPGAAWHFGGITQNDAGNRPYKFNTKFDMLLALIAWVERGLEPTYQVGVGYGYKSTVVPVSDGKPDDSDLIPTYFESYEWGVTVSRKHCPYPQVGKYVGGDTEGPEAWQNFVCA